MIKRKLILDLAMALTVFLTIWFVGQHDRNTYQIQLDHGGLSQDAMVFQTNSKQTMRQVVSKLAKRQYSHYQVQFMDKTHPHLSYIYGQQPESNLSMINGRNFNDDDYDSPLPFAITGQGLTASLYKPQEQAYVHLHKRYIPVIGTVGTSGNSPLNQHVFISLSPQQSVLKTPIQSLQVVADGSLVNKHKTAFKKMVHAYSIKTYVPKTKGENQYRRWGSPIILGLIYGLSWLILTLLTVGFYFLLRRTVKTIGLDKTLNLRVKLGLFRQFALHLIISGAIGYGIGIWQTYLIRSKMTTYAILASAVYALILMLILLLRTKPLRGGQSDERKNT